MINSIGFLMYFSVMVLVNIVFIDKLTGFIESKTIGVVNEWASYISVCLWMGIGMALMAVGQ